MSVYIYIQYTYIIYIYIRIHIHYNRIFHRGPNNPVRVLVISTVSRRFGLFLEASPIPSEGTHVWNAFVSFLPLISGRPGGRFSKLFSDEKFLHADDRHHKPELENQVNHLPNFPYLSLSPKLPTAISSSLHIGFWIQIGDNTKKSESTNLKKWEDKLTITMVNSQPGEAIQPFISWLLGIKTWNNRTRTPGQASLATVHHLLHLKQNDRGQPNVLWESALWCRSSV